MLNVEEETEAEINDYETREKLCKAKTRLADTATALENAQQYAALPPADNMKITI
jgi:hypothetical protein